MNSFGNPFELTSILPTAVFCAIFLYCIKASLTAFPFRRSTPSSINRMTTGSSTTNPASLALLETTNSCNIWKAAEFWPKAESSKKQKSPDE